MKIELNVHQRSMIKWASEHPEALVLSADLGSSCEIKEFKNVYPERYFSLGIAEQNMVSWAAGLAREGYRPFLHSFGVFLYRRVLDQLEMSVAYPNLPVTFVGFLPGIMTPGGVTHQAIDDVATLRPIPNMTILDVGDATDIESVLNVAHQANGPVYIRMLRKEVPRLFPADQPMQLNRGRLLSEGDDVVILIGQEIHIVDGYSHATMVGVHHLLSQKMGNSCCSKRKVIRTVFPEKNSPLTEYYDKWLNIRTLFNP